MLTIILKRSDVPKVIQLTQENIMKELSQVIGSEMLLEDSWNQGIQKVRTPYFCLLEPDCIVSSGYFSSNYGLMRKASYLPKGGGAVKLAMIASCLGVETFADRIYNFKIERGSWYGNDAVRVRQYEVLPNRDKNHSSLYEAQIGFVPGAIIRKSSIQKADVNWDDRNMVRLSYELSAWFWTTNRRIQINPNTTYVSTQKTLRKPTPFLLKSYEGLESLYAREGLS